MKKNSMIRKAGKDYVCIRCGKTIRKGEMYYCGGSPILKNGRKKRYLYCKKCIPDKEKNFQHSKTKKMYDLVKKHPRFNKELRKMLSSDAIVQYYRVLRKKGYPILRYRYMGRGAGAGTKKDPNYPSRFIIYYMEGEEEQARGRMMIRYPMQRMYRVFSPLSPQKNKKKRTGGG